VDRRVLLLSLVAVACNPFAKKSDADAQAPASASAAATAPASAAVPAAPQGKSLDATSCNPGTSLDPPDKGKTVQNDQFKYTLLDARTDTTTIAGKEVKALLVKLEVENITTKPNINISYAEVDATKDRAAGDRLNDKGITLKATMLYPRTKTCVDLGGDVGPGKIPPGTKVIGYFIYEMPDAHKGLWLSVRNLSPESVTRGTMLKVMGSFRLTK
jgi:hypothetical protein